MPAAAIPAAMSLIQAGIGAANKSAAADEAERLRATRPIYEISPESFDELNLAESELQGGMGSRAARAYERQSDKAISSSLAAILKGGGNLNNIGELYGAADDGNLRLAQIQDQLRLSQITNTVNARRNMTDQRDKSFMYNKDQWWKNDAQANAEARKNSDEQMWSGINGFASNAMNFWNNTSEKNQMDNYLNPPQSSDNGMRRVDYTPEILRSDSYRPEKWGTYNQMNNGFNPAGVSKDLQDIYYQYSGNNK